MTSVVVFLEFPVIMSVDSIDPLRTMPAALMRSRKKFNHVCSGETLSYLKDIQTPAFSGYANIFKL